MWALVWNMCVVAMFMYLTFAETSQVWRGFEC